MQNLKILNVCIIFVYRFQKLKGFEVVNIIGIGPAM